MNDNSLKGLNTNMLKGIAIMLVILIHTDQMMSGINRYIDMASEFGQMGCQLFFILSGFGLCYSWNKISGLNFRKRYIEFLKKRWIKIVPPYYFAILIYLLYCGICMYYQINSTAVNEINIACVVIHALLINGLVPQHNNCLIVGSWYIGTLAILYLMFPWIYEKIKRCSLRKQNIVLWISAFAPIGIQLLNYQIRGGKSI